MKSLSFLATGSNLSANLFVADGGAAPRPGVVVVGSWLTVKEQMPASYAALLADAGFAALTFDFRGFGASEGSPREVESARAKAQDILDAAAFLATRPEVDGGRVGVLAVCASAHYAALALGGAASFAGAPSPVKSAVMVAPWLHDAEIVRQVYGGEAAVAGRLERARAARARYVTTGEVEYVTAASNVDPAAAMFAEGDALDYYLNPSRGAVPEWGNRFAVMAWSEWLTMDSPSLADRLSTPLRIVTSEQSATPGGVKKFVARLRGPHDVVWTEGSQFHFYDDAATVRFAADRAAEHFRRTLGPS